MNVYVTIQLVLVDLQDLVLHAQMVNNALAVCVHVLITTMLVELTVRRVQPANIVNPLMEAINVYVTIQLVLVQLAL